MRCYSADCKRFPKTHKAFSGQSVSEGGSMTGRKHSNGSAEAPYSTDDRPQMPLRQAIYRTACERKGWRHTSVRYTRRPPTYSFSCLKRIKKRPLSVQKITNRVTGWDARCFGNDNLILFNFVLSLIIFGKRQALHRPKHSAMPTNEAPLPVRQSAYAIIRLRRLKKTHNVTAIRI